MLKRIVPVILIVVAGLATSACPSSRPECQVMGQELRNIGSMIAAWEGDEEQQAPYISAANQLWRDMVLANCLVPDPPNVGLRGSGEAEDTSEGGISSSDIQLFWDGIATIPDPGEILSEVAGSLF